MNKFTWMICVMLSGLLLSCTKSDQEKAQRNTDNAEKKADQAVKKAGDEIRQAGREAKAEATVLKNKVDRSLQGGAGADPAETRADEKLHKAADKTREATDRASVKMTHAALIAKVKSKLMTDVGLSTLTEIDVDTTGHIVTLNGTVDTEDQKRSAENAVSQMDGVSKVINHLSVRAAQ